MKCLQKTMLFITALTMTITTSFALASDAGSVDSPDALVKGLYPGKGYSPYAHRDFPMSTGAIHMYILVCHLTLVCLVTS